MFVGILRAAIPQLIKPGHGAPAPGKLLLFAAVNLTGSKTNFGPAAGALFCWEPLLSTIVSWFGSRGPNGRPIWRRNGRRLRLSVTPGHSVQRIYSKPG